MRFPPPLPMVSRCLDSQLRMGALSFLALPAPNPAAPWPPPHKFSWTSQVPGLRFPCDLDSGLTTQTSGQSRRMKSLFNLGDKRVSLSKPKISHFQVLSLDSSSSYPFHGYPTPTPTSWIFLPSGYRMRGGESSVGAETGQTRAAFRNIWVGRFSV